jgi:hypothetical protein
MYNRVLSLFSDGTVVELLESEDDEDDDELLESEDDEDGIVVIVVFLFSCRYS